jgi:hypothetical protein
MMTMKQTIEQVVIVGGGTAGWLTAALLAKKLNSVAKDAVQVTLVESPDIPIIGVGEGTWPTMRTTLQTIGIDEAEFIRQCDATFKQGAEFVNWYDDPAVIGRHSYFHPLSAVFHSSYNFNLAPYWLQGDSDLPYDLAVASQSRICQLGLAPKKITTPAYEALQNYSYHLNAGKFADFLHQHCVNKLGVRFVSANVSAVIQTPDGAIASVQTDSAGEICGDLFIDCSGSRALLLGQTLQVGWKSVSDVILNDTALAMQVPYPDPEAPIASHTIATAHGAGWTWDIGLQQRRGVGYVFSSQHSTLDQAEQCLRDYIGPAAANLEARKIPLNIGYREEFWRHNCVAVGMSAAFIEPLEASAIFLIEAAANMIAEQFPRYKTDLPFVARQFNQTFRLRWDKSIDFIKLHYCISQRRDTQYWRDNCDPATIPLSLQDKLQHWRHHPPTRYDFDYAFEPFVLDSYLFVLYGLKFNTDLSANRSAFAEHQKAKQLFQQVLQTSQHMSQQLPLHRELINKIRQFGLASI